MHLAALTLEIVFQKFIFFIANMLLFISNSNPGEYGFLKLWESFILDRMGNVENHCIKNIDIVKDYWLVK